MKPKLNRKEAEQKIANIFSKNAIPKEIKKAKKFAMSKNIKLGELRKKFCKKCYSPRLKVIGVKNKIKKVLCKDCGNVGRYKLK